MLNVSRDPMAEAGLIVARVFADLAALSIVQHRATPGQVKAPTPVMSRPTMSVCMVSVPS
jgi:hypothetical protein